MTIHSVRMPAGHGGGDGIATKGRPLELMARLKSIVQVKAKSNCLAHALIIAKAKVDGDPNYASYRHGCKIRPVVDRLLETTGIELSRGGGVPELMRFQEHFRVQDRCFWRIELRGHIFRWSGGIREKN